MSDYRDNNNRRRGTTSGQQRMSPEERERRRRAAERRRLAEKKKKQARLIRILLIVVAVLLAAVIAIVAVSCSHSKKKQTDPVASSAIEPSTEEISTEPPRSEVELVSVGDVLMHTPILNYSRTGDGTYDFNEIFSVMKDDISRADIAICNQETPIDTTIPADGGIEFIFNTPGEIGDAEINAGFDVVLQASNHSYDEGSDGILHTIDFWKTKEGQITMIGMNESQEKRDTITYIEKNGIKFGLLNYTYGLNGFELPYDMDYLVTIIDENFYNRELVENDIRTAKENADFVIVFPHWGVEDLWPETTEVQDEWAQIFTDAGADLIIGTHPHVCERIDWVTSATDGHKALCYYSLGNYASNQQEAPEVLGGMAKVKIVKENGQTYIDESATGVVPIVTHNTPAGDFTNRVVCYKLSDYTEELASQHDIVVNYREDGFSLGRLQEIANTTFGDWIISY